MHSAADFESGFGAVPGRIDFDAGFEVLPVFDAELGALPNFDIEFASVPESIDFDAEFGALSESVVQCAVSPERIDFDSEFGVLPESVVQCAASPLLGVDHGLTGDCIRSAFDQVPSAQSVGIRGQGRWQRKHGGIQMMNARKLFLAERRSNRPSSRKFCALAKAWNKKMGLRTGDNVCSEGSTSFAGARTRHKKRLSAAASTSHPNQWTLQGLLSTAYRNVGGMPHARAGSSVGEIGETFSGRNLLALTTVASISCIAQRREVDKLIEDVRTNSIRSLVITSHYDSTPMAMLFGALQEIVMPHARYFHLNEVTKKWEMKTLEQYTAIHKRGAPNMGVVEVLAQRMQIHYHHTGSHTTHSRDIIVPPRLLQNQNASTLFNAINTGVPQLSCASLLELSSSVRFMLFTETPDNAACCKRKMIATANRMPQNIFFVAGGCVGHHCYRVIGSLNELGDATTLGDIYTAKFMVHLASHYNSLWHDLKRLVDELEIVKRCDVSDADFQSWSEHREGILQHTLLRQNQLTRGRLCGEGDALADGRGQRMLDDKVDRIKTFINGDLRRRRFMHVENGCCTNPAQAKENFFYALIDFQVLPTGGSMPAKERWGSMASANCQVSAGYMVHGAFDRIVKRVFANHDSSKLLHHDAQVFGEDYQTAVKKKIYRLCRTTA